MANGTSYRFSQTHPPQPFVLVGGAIASPAGWWCVRRLLGDWGEMRWREPHLKHALYQLVGRTVRHANLVWSYIATTEFGDRFLNAGSHIISCVIKLKISPIFLTILWAYNFSDEDNVREGLKELRVDSKSSAID